MKKLILETYNHPHPYPFVWIHNDTKLQVTNQCKLNFYINITFIDKFIVDVVPLDIYGFVFYNPLYGIEISFI